MVSMYRIPVTETATIAALKNPLGHSSSSNIRQRQNDQDQRSPPTPLPPPMFPSADLKQFQLSKVRVPIITPSKRAGNVKNPMVRSEVSEDVTTFKPASAVGKKSDNDRTSAKEIHQHDRNQCVESNFLQEVSSQQMLLDWKQKDAQNRPEDKNSNPMIHLESQNSGEYDDPYKILQSIENIESMDSVEDYFVDGIGDGDGDPNATFRLDESVYLRTSMLDSSSPSTKDKFIHGDSMMTTESALGIPVGNVHSPEHCYLDPNMTEPRSVNHSNTLTVTPASFHPSPSPKHLEWDCPNMEQFFGDSLTGSVGSFASDNDSNHDEVNSKRDSPDRTTTVRRFQSSQNLSHSNLSEQQQPPQPKRVKGMCGASNESNPGHSSSPSSSLRPISLLPRNRAQDSLQESNNFCTSKTSYNINGDYNEDDLMTKIRLAKPPNMHLPPRLFPTNSERIQRVAIRDGIVKFSNSKNDDSVKDASGANVITGGTMESSSSYHDFFMSIFPAFGGCTFLLQSLEKTKKLRRSTTPQCKINVSSFGNIQLQSRLSEAKPIGPTSEELALGKRRVESAICAFGGTIKRGAPAKKMQHLSIFRKREPIGTSAESEEKRNTRKRKKYEEKQKQQYFENGSRLSWEVTYTFDDDDGPQKKRTPSGLTVFSSPNRRKKYRCKLCGQPKQNHTCPFEESLLRSIGVMVYPSINPHVAHEPGSLAPPLIEMNNFAMVGNLSVADNALVTTDEKTIEPKEYMINVSTPPRRNEFQVSLENIDRSTTKVNNTAEKNEKDVIKSVFQPVMEIAPEQYRTVTPLREREITSETGSYSYPAVPLTHAQRKSASDALFALSKKVPSLTRECAEILKEARKGDQWDLAVAELTTQVICATHCSDSKDYKLEGLRRYLLTLGIAC